MRPMIWKYVSIILLLFCYWILKYSNFISLKHSSSDKGSSGLEISYKLRLKFNEYFHYGWTDIYMELGYCLII